VANSSLFPLTLALAAGLIFSGQAKAQNSGIPYTPGGGAAADPFSGAPGMGGSSSGRPSKPAASDSSDSDSSDPDDPTLYRMKTKDSVSPGAMSRDDGELTRKIRKREKVSKVESTKQLPTSGTDSKFQGSLLQSSVGSIGDVNAKANIDRQIKAEGEARFKAQQLALDPYSNGGSVQDVGEKENVEAPVKNEDEARFKARQLMLNASAEEHPKNTEPPRTKADSSPLPSPSPNSSGNPSSR